MENKKALVVIDVQNYYINDKTKELPRKISQYIKDNKFDYLIFTKFVNNAESNLYQKLNWRKMISSPDIDICEELTPFIKEGNVFEKNTYSIFKSKSFVDFVDKNNINNLTFCGLDTDACILASMYEGFDLGYDIKIIEELCMCSSGDIFHDSALKIINRNLQ
ncbi:MAG: hypothetical protein QG603_523 [Patescibacteria group bacterium]|nr:hypothetical protein [Patescibacteria group bacterium]MDQ5970746.1 hypothetical protein [Patescibacteria group bacterium]